MFVRFLRLYEDSNRFNRILNTILSPREGKVTRQHDGFGVDRHTKIRPDRIHEGVDFDYNVGQSGINL